MSQDSKSKTTHSSEKRAEAFLADEMLEPNSARFDTRIVNILTEKEAYSKLLNQSFTGSERGDFLTDFPVWKTPSVTSRCYGAYNGNELVATAACRVALLKIGETRIKVGIIGAVCTADKFRGQGLAGQLIDACLGWLKSNEVNVAFLWGSQTDLYRKQYFYLCGTQIRVSLKDLNLPDAGKIVINHGWNPGLLSLVRKRGQGLSIADRDLPWYSKHENVRFLWLGTQENPQAFVAIDRGIDLHGIVHEWGGEAQLVLKLLSHLRGIRPEGQIISSKDLFHYLPVSPQSVITREFLTMARILDPQALVQECFPHLHFKAEQVEGVWNIMIDGQPVDGLTSEELTRVLLGPVGDLEDALAPLPIPIWFWGLDGA